MADEAARRALVVGINEYEHMPKLEGCVADAMSVRDLLTRNDDGSLNYDCRLLVDSGERITRKVLRSQWNVLFGDYTGDIIFYFSGHGAPLRTGGYIMTQEGDRDDPGLAMDELLTLANWSDASSVLLILDCCNSGHLGSPSGMRWGIAGQFQAQLGEGLTILAASRPSDPAFDLHGHGVFTRLLLGALSGGAADVRGRVSAASIYAYVEQALGPWEQRPLYKSHADRLPPVRLCRPAVPDSLLRDLPGLFPSPEGLHAMDPAYEFTHSSAVAEKVGRFDKFKLLRNAHLLETESGKDLYFVALESGKVRLTPLGQYYWRLANTKRI